MMKKVVFYTNQFFGQIGSEDKAGVKPLVKKGAVGPGMIIESKMDDIEVVATIVCGDNYYTENMDEARKIILEEIEAMHPDLVIAGPAFNAGRFGVACGDICATVERVLNIPAVTGMNLENPAVDMYRDKTLIAKTGKSAAAMKKAMPIMIGLGSKLLNAEKLGNSDIEAVFSKGIRTNFFHEKMASERALDMLIEKMAGRPYETEIPIPTYKSVVPAKAIEDLSKAKIALVSTGGIVPFGNPDRMPAATGKFAKGYDISGIKSMKAGVFESVHAGYDPVYANDDPNRVAPLDALRYLEEQGVIGELLNTYYVSTGNSTAVADSYNMGIYIAQELIRQNVDGVILTST